MPFLLQHYPPLVCVMMRASVQTWTAVYNSLLPLSLCFLRHGKLAHPHEPCTLDVVPPQDMKSNSFEPWIVFLSQDIYSGRTTRRNIPRWTDWIPLTLPDDWQIMLHWTLGDNAQWCSGLSKSKQAVGWQIKVSLALDINVMHTLDPSCYLRLKKNTRELFTKPISSLLLLLLLLSCLREFKYIIESMLQKKRIT